MAKLESEPHDSSPSPVYADEGLRRTSLGDMSPDEFSNLTLYEKKCVLINAEIDRNGMGRYQWYIWCLCGFGYLLDLLWAQAFGLVLSPLEQELGFAADQSGNISVGTLADMPQPRFM